MDYEKSSLTVFIDSFRHYELLTAEQEKECFMTSNHEKLVLHNLRLVVKLAYRHRHRGLDVEDLISEGCIGLINASKQFNPAKGRFSTISWYSISRAIRTALDNQSRTIRIPVWAIVKYLREAERKLSNEL